MQTLPEVGKIYQSQVDPAMIVFVESVEKIEEDDEYPDTMYMIEGCDPSDKENSDGMGFEFLNTEWNDLEFTLRKP